MMKEDDRLDRQCRSTIAQKFSKQGDHCSGFRALLDNPHTLDRILPPPQEGHCPSRGSALCRKGRRYRELCIPPPFPGTTRGAIPLPIYSLPRGVTVAQEFLVLFV